MFGIIATFICAGLILWLMGQWKSPKNSPPGPISFPILGNLPQMAMKKNLAPFQILQEFSKEYGPIMRLQLGLTTQIVMDDLETMKEVLSSEIWADRYTDGWLLQRSFGKHLGILFGKGDAWKEMRRFSLRTLRDFGFGKQKGQDAAFEEELTELIQRLNGRLEKEGNVINMNQLFTVSVLNILWNMMAGVRFSHDDARMEKLVLTMSNVMKAIAVGGNIMMAYPFLRHILPRLTGYGLERRGFMLEMQQQFRDILQERRSLGFYKEDQKDFIDVFLKEIDDHRDNKSEPNNFTDEQFLIVALDLFVAGSETSSNTLEFAILFMLLNPDVQKKVQDEIDSVVGRSRLPSSLDRPKMPYTEATLLEIQRLANVVPLNGRSPTEDTKLGPYDIKKGTLLIVNLYSVHLNEKLWGDPHVFRPERFLDEKQNIINTHKLLPFGYGKRVCLGEVLARATLFIFFASFMQNYTVEISPHPKPSYLNTRLGLTTAPMPYFALVKQRN